MIKQAILPVLTALISVIGLYFVWTKRREEELRVGDVLDWASETISALQTLVIICEMGDRLGEEATSKLTETIFSISSLIEQGRMFFKNEVVDNFGSEKEPAYRGYRPSILDPLIIAYQIACKWEKADQPQRSQMRKLALVCLKKFVSLGASRPASKPKR
jgi:hypothetical protein